MGKARPGSQGATAAAATGQGRCRHQQPLRTSPVQVREFTVRAAGADRTFQRFVLGKFPLGPPELKGEGTRWRKSERASYVAKPDRCGGKRAGEAVQQQLLMLLGEVGASCASERRRGEGGG